MALAPKTLAALHFIEEQRKKEKSYQEIADALGCTRSYVQLLIKLYKTELLGHRFVSKAHKAKMISCVCKQCGRTFEVYEKAARRKSFCTKECWAESRRKYEKNPYKHGTSEHNHFDYELQKKHNSAGLKASRVRVYAKHKERYHSDPSYRARCNLYQTLWHRKRYGRKVQAAL